MRAKRDYFKFTKQQLIDELIKTEVLLEQQMNSAPGVDDHVEVVGIVSFATGKPWVSMRSGEASWQMEPHEARQFALTILDSAVEAERDAATIAFVMEMPNGDKESAGAMLEAIRHHREDWIEKFRSMSGMRHES